MVRIITEITMLYEKIALRAKESTKGEIEEQKGHGHMEKN